MNKIIQPRDLFLAEWEGRKESLISRAIATARRSQSYRKFRVATAVLGYRPAVRQEDQFVVCTGFNAKVDEFSRPVCAEPPSVMTALALGCRYIVGMVVVGNRNQDHASNLNPKTLHCCGECRRLLTYLKNDEGERFVPPEAQMLFVRLDSALEATDIEEEDGFPRLITEPMSFQELCDLHANGNGGHNK